MKWIRLWVAIVIVGVIGGGCVVQARSVNDFTIQSFDADYHLTKDSENRSVLKTKETITATFPSADQNHGIERALPQEYDGHSVHLSVESVTDDSGRNLPYDTYDSSGNLVLRIGDPATYVHGQKVYVISYIQHDVTRYFSDTTSDEWYWDVNGTQWQQEIEAVSAHVTIDPALVSNVTNLACYQGAQGSQAKCNGPMQPGEVMDFSSNSLTAGETMTVALGFKPQTFMAYQPTASEKFWAIFLNVWLFSLMVGFVLAIIVIVWMIILRHSVMNRQKGRGTIIPEYLPPKQYSVLLSAEVKGDRMAATTAQILDFAVRHYIKLYETREKGLFRQAEYELEIIREPSDLRVEEKQLLLDLFGDLTVGTRFEMKKLSRDYKTRRVLIANGKKVREAARGGYGIFEKATKEARQLNTISTIILIVALLTLSPFLLVAAIVGYAVAYGLWPLTAKGKEQKDYLEGLRFYISVAEEERLKMLQSPEGAEKVGVINSDDPKQFVKLYERVLPYAVLFGQSKEWVRQLGTYYDESSTQPDWYAGNGLFNAMIFSAAISSFNTQMTTYGSSESSSSGGSTGGGFAGGGGGGGGGGGW